MRIEARIPGGEFAPPEELSIDAGPIGITFRCTVETKDGRLRVQGSAPGAGFVFDGQLTEHDLVGELHVSGTLAGLGQRELALLARRLFSALAGVP